MKRKFTVEEKAQRRKILSRIKEYEKMRRTDPSQLMQDLADDCLKSLREILKEGDEKI